MPSKVVIPQGWDLQQVGDLATFRNGSAFNEQHWTTSGLPIIRIQNLNGSKEFNHFDGDPKPHVIVELGDLLFSWSGNRGTSFGPFVWSGPKGVLNQHIFKVTPATGIEPDFLFQALLQVTEAIERRAHGGTGIVHVRKSELESFKVLVPPRPVRSHIVRLLDSIDANISISVARLEQLRTLKRLLSKGLLTGELPVSAPPAKTAASQGRDARKARKD